jgi:predicted RNase H-like HicB family nuclease
MRPFSAVVERCPSTGLLVGSVPGFPGAHSQAETIEELQFNIHEVIEMFLEDGETKLESDSLGCSRFASRLEDMSQLPVLKPSEVVRIRLGMGFVEVRQKDPESNSGIRKGVVLPFHFTRPGISRHHCSDRLQKILA